MIVRKFPHDLSEEAQEFYALVVRAGGNIQADYWNKVNPSPEVVTELVSAGLAQYTYTKVSGDKDYNAIWVNMLHQQYTSLDDGNRNINYHVEVYVADKQGLSDMSEPRLMTLRGATIRTGETTRQGMPYWRVSLKHSTARDFEHDPAYLADFELLNPFTTSLEMGTTRVIGTLSEPRFYPFGTNLVNDESEKCTRCEEEHAIVEYMPPLVSRQNALSGQVVSLVITDARLMDENNDVKKYDY